MRDSATAMKERFDGMNDIDRGVAEAEFSDAVVRAYRERVLKQEEPAEQTPPSREKLVAMCPSCSQEVRTRIRDGRIETVWHRDPMRRRKWCAGSPGQRS